MSRILAILVSVRSVWRSVWFNWKAGWAARRCQDRFAAAKNRHLHLANAVRSSH